METAGFKIMMTWLGVQFFTTISDEFFLTVECPNITIFAAPKNKDYFPPESIEKAFMLNEVTDYIENPSTAQICQNFNFTLLNEEGNEYNQYPNVTIDPQFGDIYLD